MLYLVKGKFQQLIRGMAGSWMTANMATVLGGVCIVLIAASFYAGLTYKNTRWLLLLVPVLLFLRMAMNALDGMLAREYHTASAAGEIMNEGIDIIGDVISYGSLYFVSNGPKVSLVLFLFLCWAAEFFGILGKGMPGGVRRYENVLGAKPDRAAWMGLLAVLLFFFPDFLTHTPYFLTVMSFFLLLTCVVRIRKTVEVAQGREYQSYTWIGR